jgi:hypothetical protein
LSYLPVVEAAAAAGAVEEAGAETIPPLGLILLL